MFGIQEKHKPPRFFGCNISSCMRKAGVGISLTQSRAVRCWGGGCQQALAFLSELL